MEGQIRPVRVAIVGLGFGLIHAAAFRTDQRCQVHALHSRDPQRTRSACEKLGIQHAVDDFDALLAADFVDVVSFAVPAPTQYVLAQRALRSGKHVLLEKPIAASAAQAQELHELARAKGLVTAVDFEFPELPVFRRAKQVIDSGELGPLRHAAVRWHVETVANRLHQDSWKTSARDGGGALNLFSSHVLYNIEWLLGPVVGLWSKLGKSPSDERAADTHNQLVVTLASGLTVSVSVVVDAFAGSGHRIDVYGEHGTLTLNNPGSDYMGGFELYWKLRGSPEHQASTSFEPERDGRISALAPLVQRFIDAVLGGPSMLPSSAEGVRVQQLIDAARSQRDS